MPTPAPATPSVPLPRRRRRWPWVVALIFLPFLLLGIAAIRCLSLDRSAASLRREVMDASGSSWQTKFQCSVGSITLGSVRAGLGFVHGREAATARAALGALQHASVGVYHRAGADAGKGADDLFATTDESMQPRGWSRLVGVKSPRESVLVYARNAEGDDDPLELCVAVLRARELVVVSARLEPGELARVVQEQIKALPGWSGGSAARISLRRAFPRALE